MRFQVASITDLKCHLGLGRTSLFISAADYVDLQASLLCNQLNQLTHSF